MVHIGLEVTCKAVCDSAPVEFVEEMFEQNELIYQSLTMPSCKL